MAVVEEAIEAHIDESHTEQGGGGRDWTLRMTQIQTALDGLVADGRPSDEPAAAVIAAIEARLPDQRFDHEGTQDSECSESPTTTTGV